MNNADIYGATSYSDSPRKANYNTLNQTWGPPTMGSKIYLHQRQGALNGLAVQELSQKSGDLSQEGEGCQSWLNRAMTNQTSVKCKNPYHQRNLEPV